MRKLISLSPSVAGSFSELTGKSAPEWFCTHDPVDQKLGSGGGTVHLLREAWRADNGAGTFADWLESERGIIIHAGGQSRRLPSYAAEGKALIPIPVFRWSLGQRIDQTLLDLQVPFLERVMANASGDSRWMIVSGDVMLECENLPANLPEADVVCLGIWGEPEQASRHGVFFTPRSNPTELAFMLQKPGLEEIRACSHNNYFMLDVGVWLLSARAMRILVERSCSSEDDILEEFDLYGTFGPAMGMDPHSKDPEINELKVAIVPLENGEFYHFGSGSDLIESSLRLQNRVIDQRRMTSLNIKPHPSLFVQNSTIDQGNLDKGQSDIWIENSGVPAGWNLSSRHILTGVPASNWSISLPEGVCLDFTPVLDEEAGNPVHAIRVYGIDDPFRGHVADEKTLFCDNPFTEWLSDRGISLTDLGLEADCDLQSAAIFPVVSGEIDEGFVQWLISGTDGSFKELYLELPKLSAEQISTQADLMAIRDRRQTHLLEAVPLLFKHAGRSVAYQVDLEDLAQKCAGSDYIPGEHRPDQETDLFHYIRDAMFRGRLQELRGKDGKAEEQRAFSALARAMIRLAEEDPVKPVLNCMDDQIIWGRCPVRLDLAGGWADTPPICFLNGGKVVNVAVELNGQPPIQVFARKRKHPGIRIRSIDLGEAEEIETFDQLRSYSQIGSGFAVPKAALALCGFLPEFRQGTDNASGTRPCPDSLKDAIEAFGSGIELSLLCAVPKGSGLGTSSILAATLLGVLNEFCSLGWDSYAIGQRVLVLEQMLTSGGGWQDQYGGMYPGLKYLETKPGLEQYPRVHRMDDHLMTDPSVQPNILLYYTGITRVAKNVLGEIVRGMFLNDQNRLRVIEGINQNAEHIREVLQEGSYDAFARAVARSWDLNQALDSGTNPAEVQALLDPLADWIAGCKLLGAGGGGYLLILARDSACAQRIKEHLTRNPPNARARFVSIQVSTEGLQVTRS